MVLNGCKRIIGLVGHLWSCQIGTPGLHFTRCAFVQFVRPRLVPGLLFTASEHYSASILLRCLGGTGLVTSDREMKDVPSYNTYQQHQSQRSVWIFAERCDTVRETFQSKLPSSLWKNHTCSPTFLLRCYSAYQTLLSAGDASEGLSRNSTRPLAANGISRSKSTRCHLQGWVRVRELERVCQVTVGARESGL